MHLHIPFTREQDYRLQLWHMGKGVKRAGISKCAYKNSLSGENWTTGQFLLLKLIGPFVSFSKSCTLIQLLLYPSLGCAWGLLENSSFGPTNIPAPEQVFVLAHAWTKGRYEGKDPTTSN